MEPSELRIRDLRARHLNKIVKISARLIQASDVRPQLISVNFACPNCGAIIKVSQEKKVVVNPQICACGNKKDFRTISREFYDSQRIVLGQGKKQFDERYSGDIETDKLNVFVQGDLCDFKPNLLDHIGKIWEITGIVQEIPVPAEEGRISTRFDICMEAIKLRLVG